MTYHNTYNYDFSLDQNKNQDSTVCIAIKSPRIIKSVSSVLTNNSRPSRRGAENLCGDYFCIIPVSNAGEGRRL